MTYEKEYYENDAFWKDGMLEDETNLQRFNITAGFIPEEVNSLADIGCGNGVFINRLTKDRAFNRLVGVDRSLSALHFVQTEKYHSDISDLPIEDSTFDCVTCLEVLEHLPVTVYQKSLNELARVSKNYIIVSVPFRENLIEAFNKCPSCSSCFNRELHLRSYVEKDIVSLFDSFGFSCVKVEKLGYSTQYLGHFRFRKIFYPEQFMKWNSPICPICGFSEQLVINDSANFSLKKSFSIKNLIVPLFTKIPKILWPRVSKPYWILALYKKNH